MSDAEVNVVLDKKGVGRQASWYLVWQNNTIIGQLCKFRDTSRVKHPWKAYKGIGHATRFVRAFYPADGGYRAAVRCLSEIAFPDQK
jgi:hypothetical protein